MSWFAGFAIFFAFLVGVALVLVLVKPADEGFSWEFLLLAALVLLAYVGSTFALLKLTGRRRGTPHRTPQDDTGRTLDLSSSRRGPR